MRLYNAKSAIYNEDVVIHKEGITTHTEDEAITNIKALTFKNKIIGNTR